MMKINYFEKFKNLLIKHYRYYHNMNEIIIINH